MTARKRRHPRLPVTIAVTYHREGALDSQPAELLEISLGGAFLRSDHELPAVGEDVVVDVLLPGGAVPVPLQGKVATKTDSGVGLKFVYRDGGGSRRIRELIRRLKAS